MPTLRVCVAFNQKVTGEKGWLRDDEEVWLRADEHIFSIRCTDGERQRGLLETLGEDKRWFHFEFWRVDEGVEKYSRVALFGVIKKVGAEQRFFLQRLTANSRKDLETLEEDLKQKALLLGGGRGEIIEADVSWHELNRDSLCCCFTRTDGGRETSDERHRRLQSLILARPIGRIYFMYCFSLNDYFKSTEEGKKDFTEAEKRTFERDIFEFYTRGKCKLKCEHKCELEEGAFGVSCKLKCELEKETFAVEVSVSKERSAKETGENETEKTLIQPVLVAQREEQLNNDGIDFSLFRTKLSSNDWLNNKTYRLDTSRPETNPAVEYFLRLSQTGLIEVRQERRLLGEEHESLAKILEELLRFRRVDTTDGHDSTNISHELNSIVEAFAGCVIRKYAEAEAKPLGFESKMETAATGPEDKAGTRKKHRDRRYVVIVLRDLKCGAGKSLSRRRRSTQSGRPCELSIVPSDVHRNVEVVSSFLEGTMTYNEKSNELQIPVRAALAAGELPDLSSWNEEICFFESDRALIYFEPKTILESYNHVANYEAYWRAIVRGVEHQLSIRTCLQNMETTTTKLTERIPTLLTEKTPDSEASQGRNRPDSSEGQTKHQSKLEEMASDVSEVVSLLPKLRQISTTATAFRSGKAINKFDRLGQECFQFNKLVRNIQQNVNELGNFLQYAKAQELRRGLLELTNRINKEAAEEKRRDDKLVLIGMFIAVSSIFFTSFSFLTDADTFFKTYHVAWVSQFAGGKGLSNSTGTKAFIIYLTLCLILTLYLTPRYFDWKSKKAEAEKKEGAGDVQPAEPKPDKRDTAGLGTGFPFLLKKAGRKIFFTIMLLLIVFLFALIVWG